MVWFGYINNILALTCSRLFALSVSNQQHTCRDILNVKKKDQIMSPSTLRFDYDSEVSDAIIKLLSMHLGSTLSVAIHNELTSFIINILYLY